MDLQRELYPLVVLPEKAIKTRRLPNHTRFPTGTNPSANERFQRRVFRSARKQTGKLKTVVCVKTFGVNSNERNFPVGLRNVWNEPIGDNDETFSVAAETDA